MLKRGHFRSLLVLIKKRPERIDKISDTVESIEAFTDSDVNPAQDELAEDNYVVIAKYLRQSLDGIVRWNNDQMQAEMDMFNDELGPVQIPGTEEELWAKFEATTNVEVRKLFGKSLARLKMNEMMAKEKEQGIGGYLERMVALIDTTLKHLP